MNLKLFSTLSMASFLFLYESVNAVPCPTVSLDKMPEILKRVVVDNDGYRFDDGKYTWRTEVRFKEPVAHVNKIKVTEISSPPSPQGKSNLCNYNVYFGKKGQMHNFYLTLGTPVSKTKP